MRNNTFLKYGLIGIFNTLVGYGLTFYLFYVGIVPEIANFLGYFIGFFVSYFLNRKFNFKSNNEHKKDLPKFIASMGSAYVVNLVMLFLCYRIFEINVYLSQIVAGVFYILVGYLMSKFWVFRSEK